MALIILAAIVVGIPILLLGLPGSFTAFRERPLPESLAGWLAWPWNGVSSGPRKRPLPESLAGWPGWWHIAVTAVLALLVLAMNASHHREEDLWAFAVGFVILTFFLRAWRYEFVFLMGRSDEDFPGRHDKLVWVLMLTAFAPVGLWFFRTYHLAHWPEPEPKPDHAQTAPEAL